MKKIVLALLLLPFAVIAQNDLLDGIAVDTSNQKVIAAFKGLKIVNLESTKIAAKGDLYFVVAHRFASVKTGVETFFGLDNAVTQLKFIYGVTDWLSVSAARSELAYDFAGKFLLKNQIKNGFPFAIVGFSSLAFNNTLKQSNYPLMTFKDRMIFVQQLLISRKFNEKWTLQLAPTFFHENFVLNDNQQNSQFAMGIGGRYKVGKRVSINMDYAAHLNRASGSPFSNPLSVGVDIENGGHVFQLHFTSSQGIHEAGYLSQTTGNWATGDVYFGFNLSRVW